jgi:hypothetical protein
VIRGNAARINEIRGKVTRANEIWGNVTRGNEIRGNVISCKRSWGKCDSGKHVYRELCFRRNGPQRKEIRRIGPRGNGPKGEDNTGNRTIPNTVLQ